MSEPTWIECDVGGPEDGCLFAAEYRGLHIFVWGHHGDIERAASWTAAFAEYPGGPEWTRAGYDSLDAACRAVADMAERIGGSP